MEEWKTVFQITVVGFRTEDQTQWVIAPDIQEALRFALSKAKASIIEQVTITSMGQVSEVSYPTQSTTSTQTDPQP